MSDGAKYAAKCPRCGKRLESALPSKVHVHGTSKHGVAFSYPEDAITFKCCEELDVPTRNCERVPS